MLRVAADRHWATDVLAGAALAVALSQVIGYPVFRLRGHYFAIATIAVGEIVQTLMINWDWVGGAARVYLYTVDRFRDRASGVRLVADELVDPRRLDRLGPRQKLPPHHSEILQPLHHLVGLAREEQDGPLHILGILGFGAEALLVAKVGEDAVDRLDAGGDRSRGVRRRAATRSTPSTRWAGGRSRHHASPTPTRGPATAGCRTTR